jgi:hypothetical protein
MSICDLHYPLRWGGRLSRSVLVASRSATSPTTASDACDTCCRRRSRTRCVLSGLVGQAVAVADDGALCPSAPQEEWVLRGFVDERVFDVAQFEEFALAVGAFAVVADEASARAHRFTGLAT